MSDEKEYKNIFKTTFMFGFVQVFNILVKVVQNKLIAIILGAHGMGIIGLFDSSLNLLKTGLSLGISQTAVRDVAEAKGNNDFNSFSRTISLTNLLLRLTSIIGIIVTIFLSPFLSKWSFGNNNYTLSYIWLSFVVGLNIISEGKLAILKGMRHINALAKASMIGSVVGLFSAVPFYYLFGEGGIVPSLIISALSGLFFSNYFVSRVKYENFKLSAKEIIHLSSPVLKMGIALMSATFLGNLTSLAIATYIRKIGGLEDVGFYNAGITIMNGYFGVVITALATDYYPRIAAVNNNNLLLEKELNQQSMVSIILMLPIIVLFHILLPFFIKILYTNEFLPIIDFVRIGVLGTLITIISNQVDMILIAKYNTRIFILISIFYRFFELFLAFILFPFLGLLGMGVVLLLRGIFHLIIMTFTIRKLYNIKFSNSFIKVVAIVMIFTLLSLLVSTFEILLIRYLAGFVLFLLSVIFSYKISINKLGIKIHNFKRIN